MKLSVITVGAAKEPWYQEACREYETKISRFIEFESLKLRPKSAARARSEEKKAAESDLLLKQLSPKDHVILLDEKGKTFDSMKFSEKTVGGLESGKSRLVFLIGGAYGASEELKARADQIWSLSPLTYNHLLAHVVLLEQIYRAFTIWKNISYHN